MKNFLAALMLLIAASCTPAPAWADARSDRVAVFEKAMQVEMEKTGQKFNWRITDTSKDATACDDDGCVPGPVILVKTPSNGMECLVLLHPVKPTVAIMGCRRVAPETDI